MAPQDFFLCDFKHKIIAFKAFHIASHLSFKILGFNLIDFRKVEIEHHTLSADDVNL